MDWKYLGEKELLAAVHAEHSGAAVGCVCSRRSRIRGSSGAS
jgi:hypothetical protein